MDNSANMDIDALKSFIAFTETGSFTRAAKQINRTQSAFSAQMRKLEDELEAELFVKDGRNLILSEAGNALHFHAEDLIAKHNKAVKQVRGYKDKRPLRLGCPEDYNDVILPKVLQVLQQAGPTYSIQVFSQPSMILRDWLDEGRIDAAILTRDPGREEGYWLAGDQGVWIAAKHFIPDLTQPIPLALFQPDCKYHAAALDGLSKRNLHYTLLACCDTSSAQRAIVRQGMAVGAMGKLSVTDDLSILEGMPPLPAVDIALVLASNPHPLLDKNCLDKLTNLMINKN